ncbi:MAG TPA: tyrosine-protein phosphatase [Hyphomicrobium sp.]|nr:tyrosine-protein phosphatase [Hyphomicrobium sp.]
MLKFERREERLARRAESWEAGLTPLGRAHAWLDLLLFDHGILRLFYRNRHRVTERLWRSAQPTPGDLKSLQEKGLRSVICVRGGRAFGSWPLEKEACERMHLDLHKVAIRARQAPRKQDLLDLIDLLASLTYPALIHCKSGADRTGFVAAVYLIAVEGRPVDEGLDQLSLRFGHLRSSRAGILRRVIEAYRRDRGAGSLSFRAWIESRYDPDEVALGFRARSLATAFTERLLRREG